MAVIFFSFLLFHFIFIFRFKNMRPLTAGHGFDLSGIRMRRRNTEQGSVLTCRARAPTTPGVISVQLTATSRKGAATLGRLQLLGSSRGCAELAAFNLVCTGFLPRLHLPLRPPTKSLASARLLCFFVSFFSSLLNWPAVAPWPSENMAEQAQQLCLIIKFSGWSATNQLGPGSDQWHVFRRKLIH